MRDATLLLGSLVTLISYLLLLWYNVWFTSPKQTVRKFHCFCFFTPTVSVKCKKEQAETQHERKIL